MVDDMVSKNDKQWLENSLDWLEINPHQLKDTENRIEIIKEAISYILNK